jgi:predicted nuclease of predicted toxin-antitoxin system
LSIRFQADNDLKLQIVKAVRRREPAIDFVSAQDAGLDELGDPELLDRAAAEDRVVVSHDRRTMIAHFRAHLAAGKSSPGLLLVSQGALTGDVVEALVFVYALSNPADLRDQAHYLPSLSPGMFSRDKP